MVIAIRPSTVPISLSTVFLKQRPIIDVFAALALCAVAYPFACHSDLVELGSAVLAIGRGLSET